MKKGDKIFTLHGYKAIITDVRENPDGLGYIYQCTYEDNSSEWILECDLIPIVYEKGDQVASRYGNGIVIDVEMYIVKVRYNNFTTVPHLVSELNKL